MRARIVDVKRLITMSSSELMAAPDVHYVQSWALVRMLVEAKDAPLRGLLDRYFERFVESASSDEAYDDVIAPHEPALRATFTEFVRRLSRDDD